MTYKDIKRIRETNPNIMTVGELGKIELENKSEIQLKATQRLRRMLGHGKENITCKDIENNFAVAIYEELKYSFDSCSCDEFREPETFSDLVELAEHQLNDFEITSTLEQKSRNWGSDWNSCTSHLVLNAKHKGKIIYNISLHIDRQRDEEANETYKDDDYYLDGRKNIYKILGVEVNGKNLQDDGTIFLDKLSNKLEEILLGSYINGVSIDMNVMENTEIESD